MKKIEKPLTVIAISCFIFYVGFYFSYFYFSSVCLADVEQSQNDISHVSSNKKEVFLTFDDGPSWNNTLKILDILVENNIKATFFIVGDKAKENSDIVLKMHKLGMCIEPHTYSHDYKIYNSIDTYFDDLDKCVKTISEITGKSTNNFVRLPGGSDNLVSNPEVMSGIRKSLKDKGIYYVDWNVSAEDSIETNVSRDKIIDNVLAQCKDKNTCVILMHDAPQKTTTVEALPYIIKGLKNQGFVFKTFNDISPDKKQRLINQGIINR